MSDFEIPIERCPHDRENPYSMISNALIRDENLHPSCRWMLIYLLSNKEGWKISPKQIISHCKDFHGCSRDKIYEWIKQACEVGYMKKVEWKEKGLTRCKYLLSEQPKFKKCFTHTDQPDPVERDPVKTDYKNKYISTNVDIDKKEHIKEGRKSAPPSAEAKALADKLVSKMKELKPDIRLKGIDKWGDPIDKLIRIDGKNPKVISDVIDCLDERALIYVQSAEKFRNEFDSLELKNKVKLQKNRISGNRQFFLKCQNQYPKEFKNITFDVTEVVDVVNNIRVSFDLNYKDFADAIAKMIGGQVYES